MVNYYSSVYIGRLKEYVKKEGYNENDIPIDVFRNALMICLGLNRKTTDTWIRNYKETNIIDTIFRDKDGWYITFK